MSEQVKNAKIFKSKIEEPTDGPSLAPSVGHKLLAILDGENLTRTLIVSLAAMHIAITSDHTID